jgi:hypothetical protein
MSAEKGLESVHVGCPCCGELIELIVDCSAGDQEYIEDCEVCCNPMALFLTLDEDGKPTVEARPQDD